MEEGIDLCREVIAFRADFAVPYGNIGFAYLQMGEVEKAIAMLQQAVKKDPLFVQAISVLGSAYLFQGQIEKSIAQSEKAIEIAPQFAVAHNNLAVAYFQKEEFQKAIDHCDKALEYGYEVHPAFLKELKAFRK
jgi:tetratricopeptide (TPR) repeat protein